MFRSKLFTYLFFVNAFAQLVFGQYVGPTPKWALQEDIGVISEINPKDVQDGYYYVLASEQYNYLTYHNYFHYATKLVSETGLDKVSQLEISFDPSYQKACFHFIRIIRNGLVIDKSGTAGFKTLNQESERQKGILNGKKTYYKNLDDVRKGDIIEYSYSVIGQNPVFQKQIDLHFFFTYSVPVGKLFYRIIYPSNIKLNRKDLNNTRFDGKEINNPDGNEIIWEVMNPPVVSLEDHTPSWYDPYAQSQVTTLESWESVKRWGISLFNFKNSNSKQLKELSEQLTENTGSDTSLKITKLVDFVQDEIRYSGNEQGIYSHKPHSPESVLQNRYGDCKDKSFLLAALCKNIGVECFPVLLNTTLSDQISNYLPSTRKFNHCIVAIRHKDKNIFIDPTNYLQKGSFENRQLPNYKKCMILDSSDYNFSNIPSDKLSKINFNETIEIDDETGDAVLTAVSVYHGINADNNRYTFASNSLNELQEGYRTYYLKYSDEVIVLDSLQASDDPVNNIFTLREKYLLKRFWVAEKGSKEISKSILPYSLNERIRYVDGVSRKYPLSLYFPVNTHQEIKIIKKGGWTVENSNITENNKFFNYGYQTIVEGPVLKLIYDYKNNTDFVTVPDYKDYKEKADFVSNNMVFSPVQTIIETETAGFNWPLLLCIILFSGISVIACYKLYQKTFIYTFQEEYDSIGGWLVLVALGVCFTPITLFIQLIVLLKDEIGTNYYSYLFDSSSTTYNPVRGIYSLASQGLNMFLIVASIFLIFLFFKRKNSFRLYFVGYKLFNIVFLIVDLTFFYHYTDLNDLQAVQDYEKQAAAVLRTFIASCIWVPYIWYSDRSKHTFTVGNPIETSGAETLVVNPDNPEIN